MSCLIENSKLNFNFSDLEKKVEEELKAMEDDSAKQKNESKGCSSFMRDFFRIQNVTDGFKAVLKKRDYYKREIIILLIITFELEIFAMNGKWSSLYLFLRRQLNFDIIQYSFYTTTMGVIGLFAQYVAVPVLTKRFGFQDYTVAIIGKENLIH